MLRDLTLLLEKFAGPELVEEGRGEILKCTASCSSAKRLCFSLLMVCSKGWWTQKCRSQSLQDARGFDLSPLLPLQASSRRPCHSGHRRYPWTWLLPQFSVGSVDISGVFAAACRNKL